MTVDCSKLPKTVSARIENDMHDDLMERCNKVGCRVSDFVKASVELTLYDYAQFDFGDEEDDNNEEQEKPAPASHVHIIESP